MTDTGNGDGVLGERWPSPTHGRYRRMRLHDRRLSLSSGALLFLVVALAAVAIACDGDSLGPAPGSDTATATTTADVPSPTAAPTNSSGPSPSPDSGESPTPVLGSTPVEVTAPIDAAAFASQLQNQPFERELCQSYDAATGVLSCGDRGTYVLPQPLPTGELPCDVLIVEEAPVAVACTDQSSLQTTFYVIGE